jgi:hypothetical protein
MLHTRWSAEAWAQVIERGYEGLVPKGEANVYEAVQQCEDTLRQGLREQVYVGQDVATDLAVVLLSERRYHRYPRVSWAPASTAASCSGRTGLVRCASNPAARARRRSSGCP